MPSGPFALALAAGMAAAFNPCGFVLLPAYLAMFVGREDHARDASTASALLRALAVSAVLTAGFVGVFGLFGAVISPLAGSVEQHLPWVTIVIGVALVPLGIMLLMGRQMSLTLPKFSRGGSDGGLRSMFAFGVSFAVASLSCTVGPFLAVTSTTLRGGSVVDGVVLFVLYGVGMGLMVGTLTVAVALARSGVVALLRRAMPWISRLSGLLVVVAGAYVAWYGWFELRTFAGGDGRDPVIDRALALQSWLQRAVVPQRPVVVAVVLGLLLVVVLVVIRRRPGDVSHGRQNRPHLEDPLGGRHQ
jgi:cytochrome c-type biogenesis protein